MNKLINLIIATDSYKASQFLQYPKDTAVISSYVEARGGKYRESVFFGLQAFIREYLMDPITMEDIAFAEEIITAHGEPFNREGWEYIVRQHDGKLPLRIQALPEGTVTPTGTAQVQVMNTDPKCFWLTSYIETALLRAIWYPSTVATVSREMKKVIAKALHETSDIPVADQLYFKLHDFGQRGATSQEAAMLGGMGHLINFMGTDTMEALVGARHYYGATMAGFSIPASEHSTITSWGKDNEIDAFENMIEQFGGEGKIYACVSDSYDIYDAVENKWPSLNDKIQKKGGTLVVRPDSGDPLTVPIEVVGKLMDNFGYTVNSKGFKVLPGHVRAIQGDGIDGESLPQIVQNMMAAGYSLDNLAFGMGGGLLQKVDRDTLKYAMKASARQDTSGKWHDVFKDPIHGGKKSKAGRLGVIHEPRGLWRTMPERFALERGAHNNQLQDVFVNGELVRIEKWEDIKARAEVDTSFRGY